MSIDVLQDKIRRLKCPIIVDLGIGPESIPAHVGEGRSESEAYAAFCQELLAGLKGVVPAVRFSFDQMALMGCLQTLSALMKRAKELGYYVLLDGPAVMSPWAADRAATLFREDSAYPCDGMIISPYVGSDAIKPFLPSCKEGKSLFCAVRSANKSAAELQDLMSGSRLVYMAAADLVSRCGDACLGKSGYSHVAALTAATNANAVMGLRGKYKRMFLLVDGYDYPGGNGKNCSYGFDRLGHGCAVSIGPAIVAAWQREESDGSDYIAQAVEAAERIRNNLSRYVTIL